MRSRYPIGACLAALLVLAGGDAGAARYPDQPARGSGLVCVSEGGVDCMDADTGDARWSALGGEHTLEATIAGDRVLVPGAGSLHAFDAATGDLRWRWHSGGLVFPPVVNEGVVYASDELGNLQAMDLDSGRRLWERRLDGWSYPPAIVGDILVTGGRGAIVRGLAAENGATRWRREVAQELVYRPVVVGDTAVVTTFAGSVTAFRSDGTVEWRIRDPVASLSPAAGVDMVVFGGLDGRLRARDPGDGRLQWSRALTGGQLVRPVRFGPGRGHILAVTPERRIVVLEVRTGRIVQQLEAPIGMVGVPYFDDRRGWTAVVRDAGTISLVTLSQVSTGEE